MRKTLSEVLCCVVRCLRKRNKHLPKLIGEQPVKRLSERTFLCMYGEHCQNGRGSLSVVICRGNEWIHLRCSTLIKCSLSLFFSFLPLNVDVVAWEHIFGAIQPPSREVSNFCSSFFFPCHRVERFSVYLTTLHNRTRFRGPHWHLLTRTSSVLCSKKTSEWTRRGSGNLVLFCSIQYYQIVSLQREVFCANERTRR